ncbi:MAG: class II aldolase/adducin family protein [Candidatus Omnitrophota bacterium]
MSIKEQLAVCGKRMHAEKLVIGAGGNISARTGGRVWIKKRDKDMGKGDPDDYVEIKDGKGGDLNGEMLSSETPMHLACYEKNKDINAIVHAHSPFAIAVAEKGGIPEHISYEADCIIGSAVPAIDYLQPGSEKLAEEVSERVKSGANAVLLKRHGAIAVGRDIEEAFLRIMALERVCKVYLLGF